MVASRALLAAVLLTAACSKEQSGSETTAATEGTAAAPAASQAAAPAAPASPCGAGDVLMFACQAGPRTVSVCARGGDTLTYRASGGGAPVTLTRKVGEPGLVTSAQLGTPDNPGLQTSLRFTEGADEHIVWASYRGPVTSLVERAGAAVMRDGQTLAGQDCAPGAVDDLNLSALKDQIPAGRDARYDRWF